MAESVSQAVTMRVLSVTYIIWLTCLLLPAKAQPNAITSITAPIEISAYCNASQIKTDITNCAQQAINAAAPLTSSYGGAIIHFPSTLSPYNLLGTLQINNSFISLVGDGPQSTFINCTNGANNCIKIGGATPTREQSIEKMAIWGNYKTGGSGLYVYNTYHVRIIRLGFLWYGQRYLPWRCK